MYPSEDAFAQAYGLQQVPTNNGTGVPGWSGANPGGGGSIFVGADGLVYNTDHVGQEQQNAPSQGNFNDWAKGHPAPGGGIPSSLLNALSQPAYNQAPAQQNPTYATNTPLGTQNVDPGLLAALSPQAGENLLVQGFQPQAQHAQEQMNQSLADFGISGGQAIKQQNNLQTSLAQALAPSLAGLVSNSQNNTLSAAGQGAGLQQAGGQFNAQTANNANSQNVASVNATNQGNTATYNQQQQNLMALLAQFQQQNSAQNAGAISQGQGGANAIATGSANNFQTPSQGTGGLTAALGQNYAAQQYAKAGQGSFDPSSFSGGGY